MCSSKLFESIKRAFRAAFDGRALFMNFRWRFRIECGPHFLSYIYCLAKVERAFFLSPSLSPAGGSPPTITFYIIWLKKNKQKGCYWSGRYRKFFQTRRQKTELLKVIYSARCIVLVVLIQNGIFPKCVRWLVGFFWRVACKLGVMVY